jgi:hypothetical protein
VSSDDDEEMNISSKEKTKATMNETLQNFQLDGSNMGQNSPTGWKRSRARTSDVWKSILRLIGPLAKSELCVDKTHIFTHCLTLFKLYKNHPAKLPLDFITLPTVPRMQNLESSVKRSKQARLQTQPRGKRSRVF